LLFLLRYSGFVGNNHTPITIPCIKITLIAAKTYLKDQQTLTFSSFKNNKNWTLLLLILNLGSNK